MTRKKILVINDESKRTNMSIATPAHFPGFRDEPFSDLEWLAECMGKTGDFDVMIVFNEDVNMDFIAREKPDLIVGSGRGDNWNFGHIKEEFAGVVEVLHKTGIPFLGICGGHQVLGAAFDANVRQMIGEKNGALNESGYTEITLLKRDPLFEGLPEKFVCMECHHDEVCELPDCLELLAISENCGVQAIRHRELPLYGVQFHPEIHDDAHPYGKTILQNFVDMFIK